MKTLVTAALVVIAAVAAALAAAWGWQMTRDPLAALPRPAGPPVAGPPEIERLDGRRIIHQGLEDAELGHIGFALSLPEPLPEAPMPVIIVLGGLGSGARNIAPLRDPGANAVVGYDWPMPLVIPQGVDLVLQAADLHRRLLSVPGQVVATIRWLTTRPWADTQRISLLGFSLGALVAPAVQRLAADSGFAVGWTILAYGAAGLGDLLAAHPRLRPPWVKPLLGGLADVLLRPLEPAEHLPALDGRFLVIAGRDDRLVPEAPARRFRALTPQPKTVLLLEGGHMGVGPGQQALLAEIIRLSRAWLIAEGAVNPP